MDQKKDQTIKKDQASKLDQTTKIEPAVQLKNLEKRFDELNIKPTAPIEHLQTTIQKLNIKEEEKLENATLDVKTSVKLLSPKVASFHGMKAVAGWFPGPVFNSPCRDRFGYMTSFSVRSASRLAFNNMNIGLLDQLGDLMGNSDREMGISDSPIPSGFTYFGQFVDHDITFDISSSIDQFSSANTLNNMRTPSLDLDSLYGDGPALHPFLYDFPSTGNPTAIKFQLGTNTNTGVGGPSGTGGMQVQTDFDLPRVPGTQTAIIGDPRNNENLIISQFHHAMLKFHNAVVDMLVVANAGNSSFDIFVRAKEIVTHHFQWALVNDFLKRVCGSAAVNNALSNINIAINGAFRMPVEFSVAAYRFAHSMIRNEYRVSAAKPNTPLSDVFGFVRQPNLPVHSDNVVDFNGFFETGVNPVSQFNHARKIDSALAHGLEMIPGGTGIMAVLAARNLRRGLALGLPSGQATATALGVAPLTTTELTQGLPPSEVSFLNAFGGVLLTQTPLWYYILREASVKQNGDQLGDLGAKIVADTFIRILKRDGDSYLNTSTPFTPILPTLPTTSVGDFTVADIIAFSGVNVA